MSPHLSLEQLESLARGETPAQPAAQAHLDQCAACARELAWLRAERQAFQARERKTVPTALWAGIAQRIEAAPPAPDGAQGAPASGASSPPLPAPDNVIRPARFFRVAGAAAAMAAAAAVALFVHPRAAPLPVVFAADAAVETEDDAVDARAASAIGRAEDDYRKAASSLEAVYQKSRARVDPQTAQRWDSSLEKARKKLEGASAVASDDVAAHLILLDGYAAYVRALHHIVRESSEEALQ